MFVQAPRSDVYVYLLGVALVAIITACVLLGMILNRYEFKTKVAMFGDTTSRTALAGIFPLSPTGHTEHL